MHYKELSVNRIYDSCAHEYGYDILSTLSARLKYELAMKYLSEESNVLDVGCANGIHMRYLAHHCSKIIGVDINDRMLSIAGEMIRSEKISNAQLIKNSATNLDFADGTFDLVYSFSTLLMVPDFDQALKEMCRVLKSGGIMLIDIAGRYNLSSVYWGGYYKRNGHFGVNSFNYKEIENRLAKLCMAPIETHALGFTDQWRYVPGLHFVKQLDRLFHGPGYRDLDYKISNLSAAFKFANRWYIACRKIG